MGGVRSTPTSESLRPAPNPVFDLRSFDIIKTRQERTERENTSFRPSRLLNGCAHAFRGSHGEWQKFSLPIRPPFPKRKKKRPFETIRGPQTGMLPRLDLPGAQGAFKDSMIHFCNSHYLSQFAAFFIDGRTKRSVAKSYFLDLDDRITSRFHRKMNFLQILDHQKVFNVDGRPGRPASKINSRAI